MKNKLISATIVLAFTATTQAAVTQYTVTNNRGPTATREVVNPLGTLVAGFAGYGYINESGINGVSTTFTGLDFVSFGTGALGPVTTSTSGQFNLVQSTDVITGGFSGKNVYLLVGFGGTDLASSTSLFVHKFTATFGDNPTAPQSLTLSSSVGTTLLGTEVGSPATTSSGRYQAASITAVPEPSAALLGAIGALGLLRRRRA